MAESQLWSITPGIAMRRPTTVVTRAEAMAGAIVAMVALPAAPMSANASSTPHTVPRRPSIGAIATTVAIMPMPFSTRSASSSSTCSQSVFTSPISCAVSAAATPGWRPTSRERTSGASSFRRRSHVLQ